MRHSAGLLHEPHRIASLNSVVLARVPRKNEPAIVLGSKVNRPPHLSSGEKSSFVDPHEFSPSYVLQRGCYPSASEKCLRLQTLVASKFQPPRKREPQQRHLSQQEPQQLVPLPASWSSYPIPRGRGLRSPDPSISTHAVLHWFVPHFRPRMETKTSIDRRSLIPHILPDRP